MTLPPLSKQDILKFDALLSYLKENKDTYILIDVYCEQQWGDNYQLYYSFAHHLKINGLTLVKNENDFSQIISQRGLGLKSFKKEYQKKATDDLIKRFNKYFEFISKPLLALIAVLGFLFGAYQQFSVNKSEATISKQKKSIDSLTKVVQSLTPDSINTHPIQTDRTRTGDTTIKGH